MKEQKFIVTKSQLRRLVNKSLTIQDLGTKEPQKIDTDYVSDGFMIKKFKNEAARVFDVINKYNTQVNQTIKDLKNLKDTHKLNIDLNRLSKAWLINTESEGY